MYVIFKTEHGEIVATGYEIAVITQPKRNIFSVITPVSLLVSIDGEINTAQLDELEINENYSQILNSNGEGCYVEILEMVPDMRKYLLSDVT